MADLYTHDYDSTDGYYHAAIYFTADDSPQNYTVNGNTVNVCQVRWQIKFYQGYAHGSEITDYDLRSGSVSGSFNYTQFGLTGQLPQVNAVTIRWGSLLSKKTTSYAAQQVPVSSYHLPIPTLTVRTTDALYRKYDATGVNNFLHRGQSYYINDSYASYYHTVETNTSGSPILGNNTTTYNTQTGSGTRPWCLALSEETVEGSTSYIIDDFTNNGTYSSSTFTIGNNYSWTIKVWSRYGILQTFTGTAPAYGSITALSFDTIVVPETSPIGQTVTLTTSYTTSGTLPPDATISVVFTSSAEYVADISGNTLTFRGYGTCGIVANLSIIWNGSGYTQFRQEQSITVTGNYPTIPSEDISTLTHDLLWSFYVATTNVASHLSITIPTTTLIVKTATEITHITDMFDVFTWLRSASITLRTNAPSTVTGLVAIPSFSKKNTGQNWYSLINAIRNNLYEFRVLFQ